MVVELDLGDQINPERVYGSYLINNMNSITLIGIIVVDRLVLLLLGDQINPERVYGSYYLMRNHR